MSNTEERQRRYEARAAQAAVSAPTRKSFDDDYIQLVA